MSTCFGHSILNHKYIYSKYEYESYNSLTMWKSKKMEGPSSSTSNRFCRKKQGFELKRLSETHTYKDMIISIYSFFLKLGIGLRRNAKNQSIG